MVQRPPGAPPIVFSCFADNYLSALPESILIPCFFCLVIFSRYRFAISRIVCDAEPSVDILSFVLNDLVVSFILNDLSEISYDLKVI